MTVLGSFLSWRWTPTLALTLGSLSFPLAVVALIPESIEVTGARPIVAPREQPQRVLETSTASPAAPALAPAGVRAGEQPSSVVRADAPRVSERARVAIPARPDDGSEAYVVPARIP